MSGASAPRVQVVGEALIDVIRVADVSVELPGGSAANTAVALGRLGRPVTLSTALGDDDRGRTLRQWLHASGVSVEATTIARTSSATATLAAGGAARYTFDLEWRTEPVPHDAAIVHTGSLGAVLAPGAAAVAGFIERARADGILVSVDPNVRPELFDDDGRSRLLELLAAADIVKLSDEDLDALHPGRAAEAVAAEWLDGQAGLVIVTRAAHGLVGFTRSGETSVPAEEADVVDTVGAGDTVTAALLDGLLAWPEVAERGRGGVRALKSGVLRAVLQRCARAAALTVSRAGANPPTSAELAAWPSIPGR